MFGQCFLFFVAYCKDTLQAFGGLLWLVVRGQQFSTPDFFGKKPVKIDQGLGFLIFHQGNRGQFEENQKKNNKSIVINQESRGKTFNKPLKTL